MGTFVLRSCIHIVVATSDAAGAASQAIKRSACGRAAQCNEFNNFTALKEPVRGGSEHTRTLGNERPAGQPAQNRRL